MSDKKKVNFTFNFYASVGQNIAHVERLEAHFDKDMSMQVIDVENTAATSAGTGRKTEADEGTCASLLSCIETLMNEKDGKGNYLVSQNNHWIAIFRIIVDKNLGASNTDYQGFCKMIDELKPEGFRMPLKYDSLKAISKSKYTTPFEKWQYDPAYNPTRQPYEKMVEIAARFKAILEENGL